MSLEDIMSQIKKDLLAGLCGQMDTTAAWHSLPNQEEEVERIANIAVSGIKDSIISQHACNFILWHIEDRARRKDVDDSVIAECKRHIDFFNQKRNDRMEMVDKAIIAPLLSFLPVPSAGKKWHYNTESLGMAVDRMSILSLKIWHMDEETKRSDASAVHIKSCTDKLAVLCEQRSDLQGAIFELLDDFVAGRKRPHFYFQFKMYNDPNLNPELYAVR